MKRLFVLSALCFFFGSLAVAKADELFTSGRLFKIEAPGIAPSYLLGTIHVSDPEVLALPPETKAAFASCQRLALELDFSKVSYTDLLASALLPSGQSLEERLGEENFEELLQRIEPHGIGAPVANRMQSWFLLLLLVEPPDESGQLPLDLHLDALARAQGKEVIGLEVIEEQLRLIWNLPLWLQDSFLIEALRLPQEDLEEGRARLIELYLAGDLVGTDLELRDQMGQGFMGWFTWQKLIVERNWRMAERAIPLIEEGGTFIAVGIGHLGGQEGLLQLFSEAGFTVSAVQ